MLAASRQIVWSKPIGEDADQDPADSSRERERVDKLVLQMVGSKDRKDGGEDSVSNLSEMSRHALVYASSYVNNQEMSIAVRERILVALADAEEPTLYDFFMATIAAYEHAEFMRPSVRGIERILKNSSIDDNGALIPAEK
jgi:hypothetical protein